MKSSTRTHSTGSHSSSFNALYSSSHSPDYPADSDRSDPHKGAASVIHRIGGPLYQRTKSQGALDYTRMSEAWDRGGRNNNENAAKVSDIVSGPALFSEERRNRSSSRGSARVEKRIEATLAKAEPASNARSRKSSHILGLFKENTAPQDNRKAQDPKARIGSTIVEDASVSGSIRADNEDSTYKLHDGNNRTSAQSAPGRGETAFSLLDSKDSHGENIQHSRRKSSAGLGASRPLEMSSEESQNIGDNPSFSPEVAADDASQDVGDMSHFDIPQRLLGETRSRHNNLDKVRTKATSTDHSFLGTDVYDPSKSLADKTNNQASGSVSKVEEPEEDDEESDKEQISSALYYPHQAPSPSALEEVNIDGTSHFEDDGGEVDESKLPLSTPCNDDLPSEDVDIALQSQNKSRYLHGDLQKSWVHPEAPARSAESGTSSASESEYESLDESARSTADEQSSLTDEAETTPTATPVAPNRFAKPRTRKVRRPATTPVGAVELKPYNHQVGGHTTVFRFSKRAVCKQLSNRENEFYEVVEREHPELLNFLPRYAYHFIIKSIHRQG